MQKARSLSGEAQVRQESLSYLCVSTRYIDDVALKSSVKQRAVLQNEEISATVL